MFSKRKAAFGYGEKSDFTKDKAHSPSPNSYQIINFIDKGVQKKLGYVFGESRSKMNTTGIVKKYLENVPGYFLIIRPGTYNDKSYLSNIKYTMRPKTLNPSKNK
jgi:hypothetical protein